MELDESRRLKMVRGQSMVNLDAFNLRNIKWLKYIIPLFLLRQILLLSSKKPRWDLAQPFELELLKRDYMLVIGLRRMGSFHFKTCQEDFWIYKKGC